VSYRTEEEQLAAFRQWWKENGRSLVIGVVLALAVFFGWTGWKKNQLQVNEAASAEYEHLLSLIDDQAADEGAIKAKVDLIKEQYSGTFYAGAASLLLAGQSAEKGDWPSAQVELESAINSNADETIEYTARMRLAKIHYNNDSYDEAVEQLREPIPSAYKMSFYELKGDILRAQGEIEKARKAYEDAKLAIDFSAGLTSDQLDQKISSLQVVGTSEEEAVNDVESGVEG